MTPLLAKCVPNQLHNVYVQARKFFLAPILANNVVSTLKQCRFNAQPKQTFNQRLVSTGSLLVTKTMDRFLLPRRLYLEVVTLNISSMRIKSHHPRHNIPRTETKTHMRLFRALLKL